MRERLDRTDPRELRGAFKAAFSALQRGRGLDGFPWRDDSRHRCRRLRGVPRYDANRDLEMNLLEWVETKPTGDVQRFSWVMDVVVDGTNAESLMSAGRARRRIENETFNTLSNQGCGLERNCGHGHRHLSTPALLIGLVQLRCRGLF